MDESEFITLEFDDNTEVECEILGIFELNGKEYIALIPQDESNEAYLYGYRELSDEEFELLDIDDDAEYGAVVEEFLRLTEEDDEDEAGE